MKKLLLIWFYFHIIICSSLANDQKIRHGRSVVFPLRSLYGLFLAVALPIDIPDKNVFVSYNFEGNYYLPFNTSELGDMDFLAPITEIRKKRQLNRQTTYDILEDRLSRAGFPGGFCLLRTICEASQMPLHNNGVLGDILHIILTPSSSEDEQLPLKFYTAERRGKNGNCTQYEKRCPESFLDRISNVI
ncbi:uncharacterized protein LOC143914048 [Arctopsyche grandis]|uniref:uncharacterized protein LOC143914048 n=1 Tax=Arctopsyche grandis TaxID=121162 RepID=UPI00406D97B4